MYKFIVCDFDNTLINDNGEIPLSTIVLFDKLRREEVNIAIATGRCLKSVLDYNRDVTFCDYLITSNGAYIYDTKKEKVIYKKNIGVSIIKKIVNKFYDNSIIYLTDHSTWNLISENSAYQDDYDVINQIDYMDFINNNKNNIYKIELYFKTKKDASRCLSEIKKMNLKINSNLQLHGDKYIIEITSELVNKLEGVKKVISKLNVDLNDVLAFGDGYNDIELLKNVGCSVAVDNAIEDVKKIAQFKTDNNNSKGIEKYLEKIL